MDREKVIKQLENDAIATDTGYVEVPLWLFSEIIALLKEHEAVEPEVDYICGNIVNVCGKCKSNLIARVKFCPWCGQAVKWD